MARLLQPGGVVEFFELDPRPRDLSVGHTTDCTAENKTEAVTHYTNKLGDRLEDNCDVEWPEKTPGWTKRVEEYLKAALRPQDGVPAEKLKDWLQAIG